MIARWWRSLDRRGRLIVTSAHVLGALITAAIVAWWSTYAIQYLVQNVLPPSAWTLVGMGWMHVRLHTKLDANHDDMKQHVTAATGGSDGQDHS